MTSNRVKPNDEPLLDDSQFEKMEVTKPPPKSRPISKLIFANKLPDEANKRKSSHTPYWAKKIKKKFDQLVLSDADYIFKKNDPNSLISELEAYCCAISRFLATRAYVPSATAYYDDDDKNYDQEKGYRFLGVTSKVLPDFKCNKDEPLKEYETVIEITELEIEQQRNHVKNTIDLLIESLDRHHGFIHQAFHRLFKSNSTSVNLRDSLLLFQRNVDRFETRSLDTLIEKLKERVKHITEELKAKEQYAEELELITKTLNQVETLKKLSPKIINRDISVKELEEFDKKFRARNKDLSKYKDTAPLTEKIFDKTLRIKARDLKNYRIVKGLGVSLTTRYIFKEGDNHNQNMARDGLIIDFDMTKLNILFRFKKIDPIYWPSYWMWRQPNASTFVVTERDIRNFPDIKDAKFYYWPTKQTNISKSVMDAISVIYDISSNLFTPQDNIVYKKLATNPVFIYHKFKTFLKYILTTEAMYKNFTMLYIRESASKLMHELVADEVARIQEIRKVLINMPEFRDFLMDYGDYAFADIKKEFQFEKDNYTNKKLAKHEYEACAAAIDLNSIEANYQQIFHETGADKAMRHTANDFDHIFNSLLT